MRIAMVSEHASPLATLGGVDAGGQNVHVAALARALAARGHEVVVYTRRDGWDLPERVPLCPGVDVVHVPAGPAAPLPKDDLLPHMPVFGRWLAAAWTGSVRPTTLPRPGGSRSVPASRAATAPSRTGTAGRNAWRPDVVHAHFWMSGVAALPAARAVGVPVVQTFHALGAVKRRHQGAADTSPAGRVATETRLAREVDLVVATCTDELAELSGLGAPVERVRVVPCGVDVDAFSPAGPRGLPGAPLRPERSPALVGAAREPLHRLVCVGRLVERKGVDTAVRALTALPGAELVVAGGPPAAELAADAEAQRLAGLAASLGVGDRVRLVGRVGPTDMPALLRSADVVVATPWYEPFGIVPLEAMACGRPLVGSAVGGLLDTVTPSTGVLVPPRDPDALAAAVRTLLDDPDLRRRLGAAARERAVARYSWERVAADTEATYAGVVTSLLHPVEAV